MFSLYSSHLIELLHYYLALDLSLIAKFMLLKGKINVFTYILNQYNIFYKIIVILNTFNL